MILATVVLALPLIAGCSAPGLSGPTDSASAIPPSPTEEAAPGDDTSTPSAAAPVGCELVTADLVRHHLGVDPGVCEPTTSWADGPAGLYPAITMAIDTTANAPFIMPREVCGGAGIDGALPVPGADYGYAVDGDLCVVVGSVGVKTSALLDYGVTTAEQWQALGAALVPLLRG